MLFIRWMLQPDSFFLSKKERSQDAATMWPAYSARTYSWIPTGWRYLPSFSRLIFEELLRSSWLRSDSAAALLVPFTWSFHDRRPRIYGGRRASMEQFASVNHRAAVTTSLNQATADELKAELFARPVVVNDVHQQQIPTFTVGLQFVVWSMTTPVCYRCEVQRSIKDSMSSLSY